MRTAPALELVIAEDEQVVRVPFVLAAFQPLHQQQHLRSIRLFRTLVLAGYF